MIFNTAYHKKSGGIEFTGITVKTPPTTTEFKVGAAIDISGMVLEATYSNGATRELTTGFTYSPTVAAKGDTEITISFTELGVTATTTQAISVISISAVFAENDWASIIAACQNKEVPATWSVGDSCNMTINNRTYAIDIIGKNHDDYADGSGKAPLTFQMHTCYATQYKMNNDGSNSGGWAGCVLRSSGAFKTIKSKMPAEVVAAMKAVTKKTAASGSSSTISTTEDTMFLLSELEVQGARTHSYAGEGTQYDYYKTAANRDKNDTSWWLRSPRASSTTCFCATRYDGTADWIVASNTAGVAAAWCF